MTTAIRVISIAGNPRRQSFQQSPIEVNADFRFLDAATSVTNGVIVDEMLCYKHSGRTLVKGEIGCYCSHRLAWMDLLADPNLTQMIVMEDDVVADWVAIGQIVDVDWNELGITYLKLLYKYPAWFARRHWSFPIKDRHIVQFTSLALGTGAYLITRHAAQCFLDSFSVISRPIDVQMDRPWSTKVPVFGIVPACALELTAASTISDRDVAQVNVIPRGRYLLGRAKEHARAQLYRLTSVSPRRRIGTFMDHASRIVSNRKG